MGAQPWAPTRQVRKVGSCHTDKIRGQGKGTKGEMLITGCKAQTQEEKLIPLPVGKWLNIQ